MRKVRGDGNELKEPSDLKDGIGRRLPDEWVASKSGSLDALRSDGGLVYAPKGRVAMAITR
jgi:hypothetical protein